MKRFRVFELLLLVFLVAGGMMLSAKFRDEQAKVELLYGSWTATERGDTVIMKFSPDGRMSFSFRDEAKVGTFVQEPEQEGPIFEIDMTVEGEVVKTIYEFQDNGDLHMADTRPGKERPTEFNEKSLHFTRIPVKN